MTLPTSGDPGDLDPSVQERRPSQRAERWALVEGHGERPLERIVDHRRGRGSVAPGEAEQRQPRLGVPRALVGGEERLLDAVEVVPPQADGPELG